MLFPSPSSDLSHMYSRKTGLARIRWECRTSGQRKHIPPSLSPSKIRKLLRNKISLALALCNAGLRGRGDIHYMGQLMARNGKSTLAVGSRSVTLIGSLRRAHEESFQGRK